MPRWRADRGAGNSSPARSLASAGAFASTSWATPRLPVAGWRAQALCATSPTLPAGRGLLRRLRGAADPLAHGPSLAAMPVIEFRTAMPTDTATLIAVVALAVSALSLSAVAVAGLPFQSAGPHAARHGSRRATCRGSSMSAGRAHERTRTVTWRGAQPAAGHGGGGSAVRCSTSGLVRYNPFEDTGGQQSFAMALLDGAANGVVISSLHSRQQTRIYLKTINAGRAEAKPCRPRKPRRCAGRPRAIESVAAGVTVKLARPSAKIAPWPTPHGSAPLCSVPACSAVRSPAPRVDDAWCRSCWPVSTANNGAP